MRDAKGRFIKGIKVWNKGLKGIHLSPETEFHKGHKISFNRREEQRKIAKLRGFGKWMKGRIPAFITQGKHNHPKGKDNPNWKGGITPDVFKIRGSREYKNWRRDVFLRDHFTCQECGHRFTNIVAHHLESFSSNKKLRFEVSNGKTLCRSCHARLHKLLEVSKN